MNSINFFNINDLYTEIYKEKKECIKEGLYNEIEDLEVPEVVEFKRILTIIAAHVMQDSPEQVRTWIKNNCVH